MFKTVRLGKEGQIVAAVISTPSGSVEYTIFHIAEKRMELNCDLGDVFFHWRFNQMGEEVSLRWTELDVQETDDFGSSELLGER
ncbi:hypothetical protein Bca4012_019948 [Brassica carinata]|uniref:Uncharacterized protein n=1 Tax=Brassica carinata TaxID=52824 RepID=A0A8X8BE50_BRACI|nr:hypothetical protein Bca52824_001642 [Brassica carinata]